MREAGLLAPSRARRELGPRVHDGTIITERPNEMWATDATATMTLEDGQVTVFIAVDHCTAECVGIHAAKPGTRYEALEPVNQAVRDRPEVVNEDPYGEGWLIRVRLSDPSELESLMDEPAYREYLAGL